MLCARVCVRVRIHQVSLCTSATVSGSGCPEIRDSTFKSRLNFENALYIL